MIVVAPDFCRVTGKLSFALRWQAELELFGCRLKANQGNPRRREQRVYECDACHGWHLTAAPQ